MHEQVKAFTLKVKEKFPGAFDDRFVLDVGSYDVNGSNRDLFTRCAYIGIDVVPGPGVDHVGRIETAPESWHEKFDVVICTEALEHDPRWDFSLRRMYDVLKPGGLLIITCATTGRLEHGTARTDLKDNPGAEVLGDYYQNLTDADISSAFPENITDMFRDHMWEINPESADLYFWGIKV